MDEKIELNYMYMSTYYAIRIDLIPTIYRTHETASIYA